MTLARRAFCPHIVVWEAIICTEEAFLRMDLYDQHLHSKHSFDSKADPRENVEAAIERGLSGLTFTEHYDVNPQDWDSCVYDDAAYAETIEGLRREFGDAIFIGKGVEICYQPRRMDHVLEFLEDHSFDLVILSVHYFGEHAVHKRAHWAGIDTAEGTRRYFAHVIEAVRFVGQVQREGSRVFDVLGHLDLVKRYTQRFFGEHDVDACVDLRDEILRGCLAADLTPEINTSTLRQGLDVTMPNLATVRRYAELGGQAMSVGSDAHVSKAIGAGLREAVSMLRDVGIHQLAVFKGRARALVRFDEGR
jgi:histidinol-phosphatase (PHP family)